MLVGFDRDVALDLNEIFAPHPVLVDVWRAVSTVGQPAVFQVIAVLVAFVLWRRGQVPLAVWTAATVLLAGVLSTVVKALTDRPRPTVPVELSHAAGSSFPSGHALSSLAGVLVLLLVGLPHLATRGRAIAIAAGALVALAVGFSRLALGVHYVSDVVAGWLIAIAWVALTRVALHRLRGRSSG